MNNKTTLNRIVEPCVRAAPLWDELSARLEESALKLSVGQQQRLCLDRALAVEPRVHLSDEPTSALDPVERESKWP